MKTNRWLGKAFFLGTVFFIAAFLVKPIGVSTQFSVLSGIIHKTIDPNVIEPDATREYGYRSTNAYYDRHEGKLAESIEHPLNYNFIFVLAIPLGALIGTMVVKNRNNRESNALIGESVQERDVPRWEQHCDSNRNNFIRRYLPNFLGGFILIYGARMADGCTSGHMMSGMMQGAVSGYLFAGAVFLVAIPTAIMIGNRNRRRRRYRR